MSTTLTEPAWFYVADYGRADRPGAAGRHIHAKTFGTPTTACGLPAAGMRREWELHDVGRLRETCADCRRYLKLSAASSVRRTPA